MYASFVYSHQGAEVDSVNLTISNKSVEPFKTYSIQVTRYITPTLGSIIFSGALKVTISNKL